MEAKKMPHACCVGENGKHKKVFMIMIVFVFLAIIAFSIAVIGWKMHEGFNRNNLMYGGSLGRGQMMNNRGFYAPKAPSNIDSQFILPQDALKSGELAIVVGDLETAKKAVSDVAANSEGNVYATLISYASNNVKNGTIVVQVPAEKFDATFGDLKKIGSQVVQEETLQIAPNNFYPMPLSATEKTSPAADDVATTTDAKPEITIAPNSIGSQQAQDKGYIKVVFVDYGVSLGGGKMMQKQNVSGNIIGVGNPANQNMRNNILVIVGIKLIFLIAIIGLLIAIFKKIFHRIKRQKENVKRVHIVRQMPKARTRVVRVQKKK